MDRRIFIVRHGNTFSHGEPSRRIGRRTDLPLSPAGVSQAEQLGRWFVARGIQFDQAEAAPLRRTRDTAAVIMSFQSGTPLPDQVEWLTEIDYGPDEGELEEAVIGRIGPAALAIWDSRAVPPQGWIVDVNALRRAWRCKFETAERGNTLLVTSNGVARFALFLLDPEQRPPILKLRPGSVGEIDLEGDGRRPRLICWDVRPDS